MTEQDRLVGIKQGWQQNPPMRFCYPDSIDWLIAEVERLRGAVDGLLNDLELAQKHEIEARRKLIDERQARACGNKAFLKVSKGECG